jgi:hypothetical protein
MNVKPTHTGKNGSFYGSANQLALVVPLATPFDTAIGQNKH